MSFLELDVLEGKKSSVAMDLLSSFREIEEIHVVVGEHDLLVEVSVDGDQLDELMEKIKTNVDDVAFIHPLYVFVE